MAPALRTLGTDFGNGAEDGKIFQLDSEFDRYHLNKESVLPERHFLEVDDPAVPQFELGLWMAGTLVREHPLHFGLGDGCLVCALTGSRIPLATVTLGQLGLEVQEDFAVVSGVDRLEYLHISSPSGWAPEEKIGRSFLEVHSPVPDFDPVRSAATGILRGCIERGPFVRFGWAVEEDDRLNRHPKSHWAEGAGNHNFDSGTLCLRTERQVIFGFREWNAFLFTIRVGHVREADFRANVGLIDPLLKGLDSMSADSRRYKGLTKSFDRVIEILRGWRELG